MLQLLPVLPQATLWFLWQAFVHTLVVVLYLRPTETSDVMFVILLLCLAVGTDDAVVG